MQFLKRHRARRATSLLLLGMALFLFATMALAQPANFGEAAKIGTQSIDGIKQFIAALFGLIGFALLGGGVWSLKKASEEPGRDHGKKGLVALAAGTGMLVILGLAMAFAGSFGFDAKQVETSVTQGKQW